MMSDTQKAVLDAVAQFVYDRYAHVPPDDNFDEDELARVKTDEDGYLLFTVEDVCVDSREVEDGVDFWFVSATIMFEVKDGGKPIEGSTDIYQCYRCGDEWCIEWNAS